MGISRRNFIRLAAGSAALPLAGQSRFAEAAETTIKIGNSFPVAHPLNVRLKAAAQKVAAKTGGQLQVRIFPNSALGGDSDMMSQVQSGALDAVCTSLLFFESMVPSANLAGLGFGYKNYDEVWKAWDGEVGNYVRGKLSGLGVTPLEKIYDNGFRQITNNVRPIQTVQDLRGVKIRVPTVRIQQSLFESLGASPIALSIKEVYSALKTRIADGQENALAQVEFWKFYEVQKYCSMTNHMWDGLTVVVNLDKYKSLPANLREPFVTTFNEEALLQRADIVKLNTDLKASLATKGLKINDVDPAPFRKKLVDSGFYTTWRKTIGSQAWALYENTVSAV